MAVGKITWKAFLAVVVDYCGIEGESKITFMKKFASCDPEKLVMLRRGDPGYNKQFKDMTPVYKKIDDFRKVKLSGSKTRQVLSWLCQEYENPSLILWESKKVNNHAEKLDLFLRDFNYQEQRQKVKDKIYGSKISKVILVKTDGDFTKRWLVKRLTLEVPNHDQSNGFSLPAQPKWNNKEKGLTFFWESICKYTQTAVAQPIEIIKDLRNRCADKPLIMAIHGVQVLEAETLHKILAVFWEPLINEISSQSWSCDHGDCILFLTTDLNKHPSIEAINPVCGVDLAPWDCVKGQDMIQLLKCNELKKMIHDCSNETTYLLPAGTKDCDLLGLPQDMLTKICSAVDLSSCADLEPYWKIAL